MTINPNLISKKESLHREPTETASRMRPIIIGSFVSLQLKLVHVRVCVRFVKGSLKLNFTEVVSQILLEVHYLPIIVRVGLTVRLTTTPPQTKPHTTTNQKTERTPLFQRFRRSSSVGPGPGKGLRACFFLWKQPARNVK